MYLYICTTKNGGDSLIGKQHVMIEIKNTSGQVIATIDTDTLVEADFKGMDLSKANFQGQDISKADFTAANLVGARFNGANAHLTDFSNANMHNADLRAATFTVSTFTETVLTNADLRGGNFSSASFTLANLSHVKLAGANFHESWFEAANFSYAEFNDVDLSTISDFRDVCLIKATSDKYRFIALSGIGSFNRQTLFIPELDKVICGCFTGTLEQFEVAVNRTHKDVEHWLADYKAAIEYLKHFAIKS